MNKTTKTVSKMSKTVIACELRAAWGEVECNLRHGVKISKQLADYIAALEKANA